MYKNIQPGTSVEVKWEVEEIVVNAQLQNLVYGVGSRYFTHLMGEFYCNLKAIRGLEGILHFTTIVGGKPMLVDVKTLNKALHLPHPLTNLPCIDIYSTYVFNKNEFELYVGFFCDSDVPPGLCVSNYGIHYKHFTPTFQLVALIVRSNILPKPNQDKFFDFFDLKMMFMLVTNKIDFSISYIILLNMINANLVDYMPYGFLLTSVFNIYHLSMPSSLETKATSQISRSNIRAQVPLDECEPQEVKNGRVSPKLDEEDITLANNGSVRLLVSELKSEIRRFKEENVNILGRLSYLESVAAGTLGESSQRGMEIDPMYQVPMLNEGNAIQDIDMFHSIEAVGVGIGGQGSDDLIEFGTQFGSFTAALEDAMT